MTNNQRNPDRGATFGQRHASDRNTSITIRHKSPHEILEASGSIKMVRERNATKSLLDFFGM